MKTFPPAGMYRELARQLRAAARSKTDRYAQRALNRDAERYDRLAGQIELIDASGRVEADAKG